MEWNQHWLGLAKDGINISTHNLIPWRELEEEPEGEELNICVNREGEPTGELAGVTVIIGEPVGEEPGELAGAMDNACESGESEPVPKAWS